MNQEATIVFYEISRCGYYKYKPSGHYFGDIQIFLKQLSDWSQQRDTDKTVLFRPQKGGNTHPIYLGDIHEQKGSWIVTLWNEVPNSSGNILSILRKSKVGKISPTITSVGPDNIPGFPTYFWFIPKLNLMATINLDQPFSGRYGMDRYMQEFIQMHTTYAKKTQNPKDPSLDVVAYQFRADGELLKLRSSYTTKPVLKPGKHQEIIDSASDIVRINTRTELPATSEAAKDAWQKYADSVFIKNFSMPTNKRTVKFATKFSISLTKKEVLEIIDEWKSDGGLISGRDYGFEFENIPNKVFWLSNTIVKEKVTLDLAIADLSELTGEQLLASLLNKEKEVLKDLPSSYTNRLKGEKQ